MDESQTAGPYEFAGQDLGSYVSTWLQEVQRPDARARGLLEEIAEGYDYGGYFLMANIAPRAVNPEADDETLMLYAVMAVYQDAAFLDADIWLGEEHHVRRAFSYARELTPTGVATSLLKQLARRSTREPYPPAERMLAHSLNNDPSRQAAHDRDMASITNRDIRAAGLLDPSLSIDDFLTPDGRADG